MDEVEESESAPKLKLRRQFSLADLIGVSTLIALNLGAMLYWPRMFVILVVACSAVLLLRRLERLGWLRPSRPDQLPARITAAFLGAASFGIIAVVYAGRIPPADWTIPALAAAVGGWLFYRFPAAVYALNRRS